MKKLSILSILSLCLFTTTAQARSATQRAHFIKAHPCPQTQPHKKGTCPGYVVDHIKALACGGLDAPINMQWQTIADGKAKDKIERIGCK